MKNTKNISGKIVKTEVKKKNKPKLKNPVGDNFEDVQRLVHLLQVHQVELEHQNEELRFAQEELEVSRNKYVNLFDFSPIPYFTMGSEGIIYELNLSASKMFGFERKKLVGRNFNSFIKFNERDVFHLFIKSIFNSSIKQSCELKIINKQKQEFYVLLEGLKLEDSLAHDNKCQIALIDFTEHRNMEEALNETNAELNKLNAAKDKFFSIIAHDLRSPFQSLLSSTELLSEHIESLSQEEIKIYGMGLNSTLTSLMSLLDNLLHWSLMQRNMMEYKPENLNLYDLVNNTIAIINQNAINKNISLGNNLQKKSFVYCDANMIRSVVQNLINNAIKFTPVKGRIIISNIEKDDILEVCVSDNGVGIELEELPQIFNFNRVVSGRGTCGEKGTGLGLALCKEFVERNNGRIWVESELGKGSKFIFTLNKNLDKEFIY